MKTALWVIVGIVVVTLLVGALMMWSTGMTIFGLKLGKQVENARTGVIRQTNQYVTTQQQMLLSYAKEYNAAKDAGSVTQMAAIKAQIESVSATLNQDQIPPSVVIILQEQ